MPPPRFPQLYDLMDSVWLRMYREGHPDFLNKIAAEICRQENIYDPSIQRAIRMFVRNRHYRVLMPMLRGEKPKTCNGYPRSTPIKNTASSQNKRGLGQPVFPGGFMPNHDSPTEESSQNSANNNYKEHYMDRDNGGALNIKEETSNSQTSPGVECQPNGQETINAIVHSSVSPPTSQPNEVYTPNLASPSVIMHPTSHCHTTSQEASNADNAVVSHSVKGHTIAKISSGTKLQNSPTKMSPPLNNNVLRRHLNKTDDNSPPMCIPNMFLPSNQMSSTSAAASHSNRHFVFPFFGTPGLVNPLAWPFGMSNRIPNSEGQCNVPNENGNSDHSDEETNGVCNANGVVDFSLHGHPKFNNAKSKDSANIHSSSSNIKWHVTADGNCLNIKPKLVCKCGVDQTSQSSQTDCDTTNMEETCIMNNEDNLAVDNFERELSNWSVFQQCTNGSVNIADVQKYCDFLTTRYAVDVEVNEDWIQNFCMRHKVKVD